MNARRRWITAAGAATFLALAGIYWLSWHQAETFSALQKRGAGLAPPVESRDHGTVPQATGEEERERGNGIRPSPLPLDQSIPRTVSTWPNVRVDHALYAPEETGMAIDPTNPNRMVGVAQGFGCYYFRSTDAGYTWAEGGLTDPFDLGDPTIVTDAAGTFYYGYIGTFQHSGIFVARSTDAGVTWLPGVPIIEHNSAIPFEDKEYPACDRTSGPFAGSLYMAWTQFDVYGSTNPADSTRIFFSHSRDHGATFSPPIRVSDHAGDCEDVDLTVEGAVPAVGPDGTIYLAWAGPRGIEFDLSADGGVTWGTDRVIGTMPGGWDFAVSGIYRCNGLPETMADATGGPHSGRIYVLWSDQRNVDTDVFLIHSDDRGAHWSAPVRVNGDPVGNGRDQFFPWADIDPLTGKIYVVFYDRRNTTGDVTEVWLATSSDGGSTFTEEAISQSPFTPNPAVFFGDYIGIQAYGGRVRPLWMRLDGNLMSAWTALIDNNPASVCDLSGLGLSVLPNPARTEARIFVCGAGSAIGHPAGPVEIFTPSGRLVRSFPIGSLADTGPVATWDLRDGSGRSVPSGVYLLRTPSGAATRVVVTR